MPSNLKLSIAQFNSTLGDFAGNREKILSVWQAENAQTDLVVFPELSVCGYPAEDMILRPAFITAAKDSVEDICKRAKDFQSAALITAPWAVDGQVYNAALLIEKGKITGYVLKHTLPNYGVFDEKRVFAAGPLPEPLDFRDYKLGIMICEDMWEEEPARHLKAKGADILIVPNASPFEINKHRLRIELAKARAQETGLPVVYVNSVGGQDEIVFDGASFVMDSDGHILLEAPAFEEHTDRIHFDQSAARTRLAIVENHASPPEGPAAAYQALMLGLRDYAGKNGFSGVLTGLSGGLDSAFAACVAVDALGPENVHTVMMPSPYTSAASIEDAEQLAQALGIRLDTVPIDTLISTFGHVLASHLPAAAPDTTQENIQSRIRGVCLMALSNATGKLLLTNGNKSEMATGYATLYGDMCGGFNVVKDLYKTHLYELARWRNTVRPAGSLGPSALPVIPERILTKAPTAELKHGQTDQDTLPLYEVLDAILEAMIEHNRSVNEVIGSGYDPETVRNTARMLKNAEHKRRQSAPGVKITGRAFGRDWRMPITNRFL